jgi:hypothetical protein
MIVLKFLDKRELLSLPAGKGRYFGLFCTLNQIYLKKNSFDQYLKEFGISLGTYKSPKPFRL